MGQIQLLSDDVINKIAAGEVVERPASVVKELVENAIDAGARRIEVRLDQGGTTLISVSDDGRGMDREDAQRALQRHATSKIKVTDDLFQIQTMGFRGEALASIAAVSRFTLTTQQEGAPAGTRLVFEHAEAGLQVRDFNGPVGTTVTVEQLFHNVPVRAKFLKAPASEFAQCVELMHAFSLCHPGIGFRLLHNSKEYFSAPALAAAPASGLFGEAALTARAKAVLGADAASLVYVIDENRFGQVEALVSPPGVEKATAKHVYMFVNRRWVKDKTVRFGVMRGYHTHLLKGRYPVAIVHLAMDPALVDVNVHPAKTEMRFQYPSEVQTLLAQAIRKALRSPAWSAAPAGDDAPEVRAGERVATNVFSPARSFDDFARNPPTARPLPARSYSPSVSVQSFRGRSDDRDTHRAPVPAITGSDDIDRLLSDGTDVRYDDTAGATDTGAAIDWSTLDYVGCFADCFLMFSDGSRLLAVDQHAFHERIVYERLKRDSSLLRQSQKLLVPESVQLAPTHVAALRAKLPELSGQGFQIEFDDDEWITIQAVPAVLAGKDLSGIFADLARDPSERDDADDYVNRLDATDLTLATIACHSAVRAGEHLSDDDLQALIREAAAVDFYHNCPHGRRVFRWWTKAQVAAWFDR
jgi:DNA mismatch repair protein MutL